MSARHEVWECGGCGKRTAVRHWLQRGGVIVHDPDAAFREAAGLDKPEPNTPGTDRDSRQDSRPGKPSRGESPCCPGAGSMAHVRGCRNHPEADRG